MTHRFLLPGHIDSAVAPHLMADLLEHRQTPMEVDGSEVSFAGALGLQVLVAARRQWDADEHAFRTVAVSPALADACAGLGVPLADIGAGEGAT